MLYLSYRSLRSSRDFAVHVTPRLKQILKKWHSLSEVQTASKLRRECKQSCLLWLSEDYLYLLAEAAGPSIHNKYYLLWKSIERIMSGFSPWRLLLALATTQQLP